MGLDQYMRKKVFIGANYEHREVKGKIDITIKGEKVNIDFNKVSYIEEQVAYWRKANQIHNWFVTNVQNGNDDCGTYFISKEHFEELYNECKEVMENKELASELLPTTNGFFFGGTEYDEYYFKDIEYTINIVKEILDNYDVSVGYYYTSSW